MKKIIVIYFLILCIFPTHGQEKTWADTLIENISKTFYDDQIKYYGLDSAKLPYGLIYNKVTFANSDFSLYDGLQCNYANCDKWTNVYNDLQVTQLFNSVMDTVALNNKIEASSSSGSSIPLGLIDVFYSQFKTNAFKDKLVELVDSFYIDRTMIDESAYDVKRLFVFSPLHLSSAQMDKNFYLDSNLFVSNNPNKIKTIEIDFGDGNGFVSMWFNEYRKVNYSFNDTAQLIIKITYVNDKQSYGFSNFIVSNIYNDSPLKATPDNPAYPYLVHMWPNNQWTLSDGSRVYIQSPYVDADSRIRRDKIIKPFLFVEGLNFKPLKNDIDKNPECEEMSLRIGTLGWDIIRSGVDPRPQEWERAPYQLVPEMIDRLQYDGFDVLYLDFADGSKSIDINSDILVELIKKINSELKNNGSHHPINIMSVSMGGIVTRMALTKMENDASVNYEHNVRNWISFDSPHNGANIPLGLQYLNKFIYPLAQTAQSVAPNQKSISDLFAMWNNLNSDAPKQLLTCFLSDAPDMLRLKMINDPNYAFPKKTFSVGISNGSYIGSELPNKTGQFWMDYNLLVTKNLINYICPVNPFDFRISLTATSVGMPTIVFQGKVTGESDYINVDFVNKSFGSYHYIPYDNMPGGKRSSLKTMGESLINMKLYVSIKGYEWECKTIPVTNKKVCVIQIPDFSFGFINSKGGVLFDDHSFIPATSALALDKVYSPSTVLNTLFQKNAMFVDKTKGYTPFDMVYIAPDKNEVHCQVTWANKAFIENIISGDNSIYQNTSLRGIYENRTSSVFGRNSNADNPNTGDVVVETNHYAEIRAGEKVVLKEGFKVQAGGELKVVIAAMPSIPQNYNELKSGYQSFKTEASCPIIDTANILLPPQVKATKLAESELRVFPVPANTIITISGLKNINRIAIYSIMGSLLFTDNINEENERQIDVSQYPSGLYLVKAYQETGDIVVKRIVVE